MTDTRYQDAEWLHEQYHGKELSQAEIGDKCDVDQKTVHYWLRKHDIETRNTSVTPNRRTGVRVASVCGYQLWKEASLKKEVAVHRLLAVAEHGFDAVCDMDVHHKNGIRWDNRPDNIELLTHSEHSRHHSREHRGHDDVRYRNEEWLKEQYHEHGLSIRKIADKCSVSQGTVQYWMQKHDIERREVGYNLRSDTPTGQLTLDDTRELEGAQTVNQ